MTDFDWNDQSWPLISSWIIENNLKFHQIHSQSSVSQSKMTGLSDWISKFQMTVTCDRWLPKWLMTRDATQAYISITLRRAKKRVEDFGFASKKRVENSRKMKNSVQNWQKIAIFEDFLTKITKIFPAIRRDAQKSQITILRRKNRVQIASDAASGRRASQLWTWPNVFVCFSTNSVSVLIAPIWNINSSCF